MTATEYAAWFCRPCRILLSGALLLVPLCGALATEVVSKPKHLWSGTGQVFDARLSTVGEDAGIHLAVAGEGQLRYIHLSPDGDEVFDESYVGPLDGEVGIEVVDVALNLRDTNDGLAADVVVVAAGEDGKFTVYRGGFQVTERTWLPLESFYTVNSAIVEADLLQFDSQPELLMLTVDEKEKAEARLFLLSDPPTPVAKIYLATSHLRNPQYVALEPKPDRALAWGGYADPETLGLFVSKDAGESWKSSHGNVASGCSGEQGRPALAVADGLTHMSFGCSKDADREQGPTIRLLLDIMGPDPSERVVAPMDELREEQERVAVSALLAADDLLALLYCAPPNGTVRIAAGLVHEESWPTPHLELPAHCGDGALAQPRLFLDEDLLYIVSGDTEELRLDSVAVDLSHQCVPQCEDVECGPDGCGGVCHECDEDSVCDDSSHCICETEDIVGCLGKSPAVIEGCTQKVKVYPACSAEDEVMAADGYCSGGECHYRDEYWGQASPCAVDADCPASLPCIVPVCLANSCVSVFQGQCCQSDADCLTLSDCISGACTEGVCEYTGSQGCCISDNDCQDGNVCTPASCAAGTCDLSGYAPVQRWCIGDLPHDVDKCGAVHALPGECQPGDYGYAPALALCYGRVCGPPVEGEGSCGTCPEGYSCAANGEECTAKYHGTCRVGTAGASRAGDRGVLLLLLLLGAFIVPVFGARLAKRKLGKHTTCWGSQ